ncbi:MAG: GGDEF domain-containing protein [Clostridiaceae bacterium]|nr:GGDEF domain-containing protein [Clostridiaceae bacterium]
MPLQAQDTLGSINIIISLCFSFLIPLLSFWFKKADERLRLFAFAFYSVFILNVAAALSFDPKTSQALQQYTDTLLLLLFIAVLATGSRLLVRALTILAPGVLAVLAFTDPSFIKYEYHQNISAAILTLLSLTVMYIYKSKKGADSLLFWSILPMLASALAGLYPGSMILSTAVPFLRFISYVILLYFFYKSIVHTLLIRSNENEKKLSGMDRSVEAEVRKRLLELENINKKLLDISKTDALSNVLNKAAVLKALERLITSKPKSELSLLMFDIDDFKVINDTHGHIVGDKCIRMLASAARDNFRDIDLVGRYGGDEFLVVLPDTGSRQAIAVAERFRRIVAESTSPHFTISIGISSYPSDGTNVRALIQEADRSLYTSKRKGKNAVSHSSMY